MKELIRRFSLILFVIAALLIFASQRYAIWPQYGLYAGLTIFGLVWVMDALNFKQSQGLARDYLRVVLAWKLSWILGAGLYFLSRLYAANNPQTSLFLLVACAVLIIIGTFVGLGIELAALRPYSFDTQDAVSRRWRSSFSLALVLLGLMAFNYVAFKKDKSFDLTFLKTSAAGEASKKIVERLPSPVRVGLFFSKESEVLPRVREYFQALPEGNLKLEYYDKDYNPTQAEEFRAAKNGQVVLMDGDKRQRFDVGDRMDEARRNLRILDAGFQKALLQLTSEPAAIYFTSTHGEMLWDSGSPLRSLSAFETILRTQNFRARRLTAMFHDVPEDAKLLAIIGPNTGFVAEEMAALERYIARGGRILLALDLDRSDEVSGAVQVDADELPQFLDGIGLHYDRAPVAHDERFVTNSRQKSDRYFIFSNKFAKHPASSTLASNSDRLTVMSFRTGSWSLAAQPKDWRFTPIIESITGSFIDRNGNLDADKDEPRDNYPLAVAGETASHAKIVAFADASIFSDTLMKVSGNQFAALDAVRWLSDRTEQAGGIESEEDVLIRQENSRELLVFHGSIYLVPLLVLGAGFYVNRRKKGQS